MVAKKSVVPVEKSSRGAIYYNGIPYARLPQQSREKWLKTISRFEFPDKSDQIGWYRFQNKAYLAARQFLNPEIRKMLKDLSMPNGIDALIIDNLPIGDLAYAPTAGLRPKGKSAESEAVLAGLIRAAGCQVFGYAQEKAGEHIHQVTPLPGKENTQSNAGRVKFGYHTDNACLPTQFQPACLGLLGLINENDVPTLILRLEEDILRKLPSDLLRELRKPIFRFAAPQSFNFGGYIVVSKPRAVIYDDVYSKQHIALPGNSFRQDTLEAEIALRDFRAFLETVPPRKIVVSPGRFLAFRNSRVVHGRAPITGHRWLQRTYFSRSLAAYRKATSSGKRSDIFDARLLLMA